jgi:hypothetical protein
MDHWPALAALPLVVEELAYGRLDAGPEFGEAHATRRVRLTGAGHEGLGEDITLFVEPEGPELALAGTWTLGSFCAHLDTLEQWPNGEPEWGDFVRRLRNWAYESAALDLALTQAGRQLHAVLGREPRAVSYVNSFGREDPDVVPKVLRRLERYPALRFKLDAHVAWSDETVAALARTGAVDIVDFKGRYGMEVEDPDALHALYDRVLGGLPDVLIEDPHDLPAVTAMLEPHADRVSYDAPIHAVADLDAQPIRARTFNIKPSRVGRLRDLFALYAACEERGFDLYGGGMGELGVARGQIQLLAAMFSPAGSNDVAPPGFNALEPAPGLPLSPLPPDPAPVGFRRRDDR